MKKDIVKINKDTTVEFALFKKFTEFLYEIEIRNIKEELIHSYEKQYEKDASDTDLYYFYVGLKLLNGLGVRTLKNYFNEKTSFAPIEKERFIFFCNKFEEVFDALPAEEKIHYDAIYVAFIEWRNKIYTTQGWDLPDNEILNEDSDKPTILISNLSNLSNSDSHLEMLIPQIRGHYRKQYDSEVDFYRIAEEFMFHCWAKLVNNHIQYKKTFTQEEFERRRTYFKLHFAANEWELFERRDDKIIEKALFVSNEDTVGRFPKPHLMQMRGEFSDKSGVTPAILEYDMANNVITIAQVEFKSEEIRNISYFQIIGDLIQTRFLTGHSFEWIPGTSDINFKICVLRMSSWLSEQITPSENRGYFEYSFDSNEVPYLIKSIIFGEKPYFNNHKPYSLFTYSVKDVLGRKIVFV